MKKKSGLRPTLSAQTRANRKAFPFFIRRALTGGPLVDAQAFTQKIEQVGEEQNSARIVQLPDGEAVLFLREEIYSNGKPYGQLTAFDVSEQYRITAQLKANNKKLTDL